MPPRYAAEEPAEKALVEALRANPRDDETRQVYADWLEQHGYALRATFLRVECRRADDLEVEVQLRALAADTPVDRLWRAMASRAPVACVLDAVDFALRCPKRWDSLSPTANDAIRHCAICERPVYFCTTLDEVRERGAAQQCIAVDAGLVRNEATAIIDHAKQSRRPRPMVMGMVAPPPPRPDDTTGRHAIPDKPGLFSRIKRLFGR